MTPTAQKQQVTEFIKRCRSMLWRSDQKAYVKWEERIKELVNAAKYSNLQASVQAAKDHACLKKLFREYDVSAYDPNPESHPPVLPDGSSSPEVECEGKDLSHRENLKWAINAAGHYLRTGEKPTTAPNDAAYWLYQQAQDEPKDFLAKFNQVESKGDSELDEQRKARSTGKRRIEEIDEMLSILEEPIEGEEET
ncbi:MAG: hypothetical protein GY906_23775 [bacterium]|nr:hypothetical protein [bacterium]